MTKSVDRSPSPKRCRSNGSSPKQPQTSMKTFRLDMNLGPKLLGPRMNLYTNMAICVKS